MENKKKASLLGEKLSKRLEIIAKFVENKQNIEQKTKN
jgi:hypothetical protein